MDVHNYIKCKKFWLTMLIIFFIITVAIFFVILNIKQVPDIVNYMFLISSVITIISNTMFWKD